MIIGLFSDTYEPYINGVSTSVATLKNALEKNGHTVYVITTNTTISKVELKDRILRIGGVELKKLYGNRMTSFYSFKALRFIKQMNLDIIHVHTEFGIGIFGRIVADALQIPVVYTYHTMYEDYSHYVSHNIGPIDKIVKKAARQLSKVYSDKCTELVTPSIKTKEALETYKVNKNIHVIPTGIDIEEFSDSSIDWDFVKQKKEELGLEDKTVLLTVGRLGKEKSVDLIINAFNKVYQHNKEIRFVIVGDGPALESLKELVNSLNLNEVIRFTGGIPHAQINNYYRLGNLFVSASITETQGLTYVEAQASGLGIICRYDENLEDVIKPGVNGEFFKDEQDFEEKLEAVLKYDLEQLRENAINSAKQFSSETFYEQMMFVYQEAIKHTPTLYRIESIKQNYNAYNVVDVKIKSGKTKTILKLPEDVVNDFGIKVGREYDRYQLESIRSYEGIVPLLDKAMKWLASKPYTKKEMEKKLKSSAFATDLTVAKTLLRLETNQLINDDRYATNYLKDAAFYRTGIDKACKDLIRRGIDEELVMSKRNIYLHEIDVEKALHMIEKHYTKNTSLSRNAFVKNIKEILINEGFVVEVIDDALEAYDFEDDAIYENILLLQEYANAQKKLETKYQGEALIQKIYERLILKGFEEESVYELITRMNEEEENESE